MPSRVASHELDLAHPDIGGRWDGIRVGGGGENLHNKISPFVFALPIYVNAESERLISAVPLTAPAGQLLFGENACVLRLVVSVSLEWTRELSVASAYFL